MGFREYAEMGLKWVKSGFRPTFHPFLHPKTHFWTHFSPLIKKKKINDLKPMLSGNKLFSEKGPEAALTQHDGRNLGANFPESQNAANSRIANPRRATGVSRALRAWNPPKVWKKSPGASGPGGPQKSGKKSRKSPKSPEKVSKMSVRDFFETFFQTFGDPGAPGDFFFRLFGDFGPGGPERLL